MENNIHVGSMIKAHIEKNNLVRTHIAWKMNIPNTAIYGYENRHELKTATLVRICTALKYNFFMDLANLMPQDFAHNMTLSSPKDDLIKQLTEEIQKLKSENSLLKELIMGRK